MEEVPVEVQTIDVPVVPDPPTAAPIEAVPEGARPLRIDLPSGGWAQFVNPDTMTRGRRKRIDATMLAAAEGSKAPLENVGDVMSRVGGADAVSGLVETYVLVLVESWSYPAPISTEALDDLTAKDWDTLSYETSQRIGDYFLDVNASPDPKAGTGR